MNRQHRCTAVHNPTSAINITITDGGSENLTTFVLTVAQGDVHIDFIKGFITRMQADNIKGNDAAICAIALAHSLNMHTACAHHHDHN